jgi:site-specific DNA recombinase
MTENTIRFASWERVSTEDRQDPESSRAWQYARGKSLIEPHGGVIVAEFFDVDKSRSIPPQRRPEASKLLAALADPGRGFDAVVVGEPQRAFYGNQFGNTFPCSSTTASRCGYPRLAASSTRPTKPTT